jgi:hypothetical protein
MYLLVLGFIAAWATPLYNSVLLVTLLVLVLVALVGALVALWLTAPRIRRWLDAYLLSPEQAMQDQALALLDLDLRRYLKVKARQPQVIDLTFARKGRSHVSL